MVTRQLVYPLVMALGLWVGDGHAAEKVTLALSWTASSDEGPVYWAKEQGWYADAGIDLTIEEGRGAYPTLQRVGEGDAQFAIANLVTALQIRGQGADVVGVMAIYANSPYGLSWKKGSGIETIEDLKGKRVGAPPFDTVRQMWPAIADAIGLAPDAVEWIDIEPGRKMRSLDDNGIDAVSSTYSIHHAFEESSGENMGFVALRDVGFNPYGNSIVVDGDYMRAQPDVVDRFVKVTQKAYAQCLVDPEPCLEAVAQVADQSTEDMSANWQLLVELIDGKASGEKAALGYFDPARLEQDYKSVEASFDILDYDVTEAYTNEFLDTSIKMSTPDG